MANLRYGLVGCGAAGKVHGYHFSKCDNISFVGISDTNDDSLKLFSSLFNTKYKFINFKKLLEKKLDLISIATPPFFHKEQVLEAAKNGINILCEKPLASNFNDAKEMIKICKSSGVFLGVMLPRRFYNNSLIVKKVINLGKLGKIKEVNFVLECNKSQEYYKGWRGKKNMAGGGILMSQAIHCIDQLVFFFGKPLKVKGNIRITRDYIEVEDEADGIIEFESGVIAKISATANSSKVWQGIISIIGEKGKIVLDSSETLIWEVPEIDKPLPEIEELIPSDFKPRYYGPGHLKVIEKFISAIKKNNPEYVSGEDCLDAMRIIFGIYKSSEEKGRVVDLIEIN